MPPGLFLVGAPRSRIQKPRPGQASELNTTLPSSEPQFSHQQDEGQNVSSTWVTGLFGRTKCAGRPERILKIGPQNLWGESAPERAFPRKTEKGRKRKGPKVP